MYYEFTIQVQATGTYTEDQLKEYLLFSMGFGSCPQDSPFIDEGENATVTDVEFI